MSKKDLNFEEKCALVIRQIVIQDLIGKRIKETPYAEVLKETGNLPSARYISDDVLKWLMMEYDTITK